MTEELKTSSSRSSEVIVNSDWLTTVGTVVGFVVCSWLLIGEIRHFAWGHFPQPVPVRRDFFGILNEVYKVIACILAFALTFEFQKKLLKVACLLGGLSFAVGSLLGFLHISSSAFHAVAMARSVMWQVALVFFLVAIAQWLRSVVKPVSPSGPPGGER
jgi:hypothetical protein